jgi:hypothetical protein
MNHTAVLDPSSTDDTWCEPTQLSTATSVVSSSATDDDSDPLDLVVQGWWNGLRDTAGGVVRFVQRSAQTLAQEMAALEFAPPPEDDDDVLHWPWEIQDGGQYRTDPILKEKILQLSHEERAFTEPYSSNTHVESEYEDFEVDDAMEPFELSDARVELIHRLLEMDPQLAKIHTQYSGRSTWRECDFWGNYFHACQTTRTAHLQSHLAAADRGDTPAIIRSSLSQLQSSSSFLSNNSFVPCSDDDQRSFEDFEGDEASFVCLSAGVPSAPNSCMSTGMKSVDSLVLVDIPGPRDSTSC